MPRLLSAKQRTALARIAKEAWSKLDASGAIDEPFADWRHRIAKAATNGRSISTAYNDEWDALIVAFKSQAGNLDGAFAQAVSRTTNTQRQLWHRITQNLTKADLPDTYALKIALNAGYLVDGAQSSDLQTLPVRELTQLSYTVARAVGALLKRQASTTPTAS